MSIELKMIIDSVSYHDLQMELDLRGLSQDESKSFLKAICSMDYVVEEQEDEIVSKACSDKVKYFIRKAMEEGDIGISDGLDILGIPKCMPMYFSLTNGFRERKFH